MADKRDGLKELKCYQCGEIPCTVHVRIAMPIYYRSCLMGKMPKWVGTPERVKQKARRSRK